MARVVASLVPLLLLLLLCPAPLGADGDDIAQAEAAVAKLTEQIEAQKAALATVYKELEHDFLLLRSDDWTSLSAPFQDAVAVQSAALTAEPETDPEPLLAEAFGIAGLLSTVISDRLAAAAANALTKGDALSPAEVLTAAIGAVFPEETFEACWEQSFLDLPAVVSFSAAHKELATAERRLARAMASSGEKPAIPHGMVMVPRGRFIYGPWKGWDGDIKANKETKARVDAFFIDIHEVTNEDYLEFLNSIEDLDTKKMHLGIGFEVLEDGTVKGPEGRELWPVRGINFLAAIAYAGSMGKRLPTEEEWEKAARGEKGFIYPWGNEPDATAANAPEAGMRQTARVGSHPGDKSPYGVMDMAGNVSELTSTLLDRRPYKGKLEASDSIVYRGGNFLKGGSATVAGYRYFMAATSKKEEVGFRCVISEKAWKRMSR